MNHDWNPNTTYEQTSQAQRPWRECPTCSLNLAPTVSQCPRDGTLLAELVQAESLFDGQYEMLSVIASGGMGTVYKAVKRSLSKTVAIKMLKTQDSSTTTFTRFRQEAYTASLLHHPNIIGIDDFGITADGQPFMVMDFIEGIDLSSLIKSEQKLKPPEAVPIFLQIVAAMEHAHSKGILHRDLKPSNVMLATSSASTGSPRVKIVDFGIAKFLSSTESQHLTQTGELFGSPFYMSPEQTVAKAADQRSDIYAIGCIMYEALSGDVPISGNTAFETLMKHVSEKPIPIQERKLRENISDGLHKLIMKALEKEPGKRHQSMTALREALESVPEAIGKKPSPFSLNSTIFGITPGTKKVILASTLALLLAGVSVSQMLHSGSVSEFFKTAVTNLAANYSGGKLSVGQGSSSSERAVKPMPIERPHVSWRSLDNKELNSEISNNLEITDLCLEDCAIDDTGASYLQALNLTHLEVLRCPNIKTDGYRSIIRAQPHLQSLIISNEDTSSNDETVANPETSTSDDIIPELKKLKELKSLSLMNFADLRGENLHLLPKSLTNLSLAGNKRIPTNKLAELATYTSLNKLDLSKTLVSDATLAKLTNITGLQVLKLNDCPIGDDSMDAISRFKNLQKLSIRKTLVSRDGFYKLATLPALREIDVTDVDAIKATDAIRLERLFKQRFCLIVPYISRSEPLREGELDKLVAPVPSN